MGSLDLQEHQLKALERLSNGRILCGGTGVGKSRVAVAYYISQEAPKDVYVITTAKKRDSRDWEGDFAKVGVGRIADATVAGILTVDSWNNIGKYSGVDGGFFIFDEQRLVGNGHWVAKFLAIAKRNRWILLSATPGDNWLDYIPVFVANGFYANRTAFKREHVVYNPYTKFPKVQRYLGTGKLVRLRDQILVHMPYQRRTERVITTVPVQYDKELLERVLKKRWNVYENKPLKGVAELFSVMRKVVNSDSTRIQMIMTLLREHPRLIIFYNFNYELEALRTALASASCEEAPEAFKSENISTLRGKNSESIWTRNLDADLRRTNYFSMGEWNGQKHEEIPKSERWVYLVQYAAGAEGWNCTSTDAMIFYSLPYSYKLWQQAYGRIDRLNTLYSRLYYYILLSNSVIDFAIKKSLDGKRNFNESAYSRTLMDQKV